jgi:formate--tetrahydrofolate ligase
MQSDIEIAQKAEMKKISDIATLIGTADEYIEPYGHYKSKIALEYLDQLHDKPNGKRI